MSNVEYSSCTTGDVKLTSGSNKYEGRVEICKNRVWGSICDSGWNDRSAYAVCRQLEYSGTYCLHMIYTYTYISGGMALSNSYFGVGTNPLHIYDTSCSYYSTTLQSCSLTRFPYSYSTCNNYQEAGVRCERKNNSI